MKKKHWLCGLLPFLPLKTGMPAYFLEQMVWPPSSPATNLQLQRYTRALPCR